MEKEGLIGYFKLNKWYDHLSDDEKEKVSKYYFFQTGLSFSLSLSLDSEHVIDPGKSKVDESILVEGDPEEYLNAFHRRLTRGRFLQKIGDTALSFDDYQFANEVYKKALETRDIDILTRHFILNTLIDLSYRKRIEEASALEQCILYCKEDLKYLDDMLDAFKKEDESIYDESESRVDQGITFPLIPAVERLAIIYEKQGEIEKAIEICDLALAYELRDSTKGGFRKRKERLQRKLGQPRRNVYITEKKRDINRKKEKRPLIPYEHDIFDENTVNFFHVIDGQYVDNDYGSYCNKLVNHLFDVINQSAKREIAFRGYRKNYPLPIVTTYQCVEKNDICIDDTCNIDIVAIKGKEKSQLQRQSFTLGMEVFTDETCNRFIADLYRFLKGLKPSCEIQSIHIGEPWLLSVSAENINRTHMDLEFRIKINPNGLY